ncbi:hypothetical protein [Streptomyces sp. NPDC058424]
MSNTTFRCNYPETTAQIQFLALRTAQPEQALELQAKVTPITNQRRRC